MNKIFSKCLTFNPTELRCGGKAKMKGSKTEKTNFRTNDRKYPADTFLPIGNLTARSDNPKVNRKAPLTSF